MARKYEIKTINDIIEIPLEDFDEFIEDFTRWLGFVKMMKKQTKKLNAEIPKLIKTEMQKMVFIPDGKNNTGIIIGDLV